MSGNKSLPTVNGVLVNVNGGWLYQGDTISDAVQGIIREHLALDEPDAVLSIETDLFNVCLTADSCEYNIDIGKNLFLNKGRWSRLIKEYVPHDPLERFIDQACEILHRDARRGATANMLFRDPDRYAKKHRWGGCLMGASFRGDNHKAGDATLTFYSRTTYIGYMGILDAAIAACMAKAISDRMDAHDPMEHLMKFRWYIASSQLHCFKTLPYIYSQPDLMEKLERYGRNPKTLKRASPTWRHIGSWFVRLLRDWDKYGNDPTKFLGGEKYGPYKRVKRRWLEHKGILKTHIPPSLLIDGLDFSKAV